MPNVRGLLGLSIGGVSNLRVSIVADIGSKLARLGVDQSRIEAAGAMRAGHLVVEVCFGNVDRTIANWAPIFFDATSQWDLASGLVMDKPRFVPFLNRAIEH